MPVILITGATDGLGRALAVGLGGEGATLILHGRDADRLEQVAAEVTGAGGAVPQTVVAALADLGQVRRLAAAVRDGTDRLDVLVSNAGIGSGRGGSGESRERQTSADGHELRFAVNYLAGFLLTHELLELLQGSAPARIVNVASLAQQPLDFDDLMLEHDYQGGRAYAQSKLAQIMSGFELAGRLAVEQVTVNSLHPSTFMPTKIVLQERGGSIDSLQQGVDATRRLAVDPELARTTGRFFDRFRDAEADPQAYDAAARAELWQRSEQLVGI
ncbi:MAG: SDR family NAD(P)-dependent oxidoreductase [Solirubrobacteraceae bacterium]